MRQAEAEKQWFDTTFVDVTEMNCFTETIHHLYLNIYLRLKDYGTDKM